MEEITYTIVSHHNYYKYCKDCKYLRELRKHQVEIICDSTGLDCPLKSGQ